MINTQGRGLPESTVTKLLLARSVATKPKLLFLENTFEQLDEKDCRQIIDFITAKQHGWTMVTVSSNKYLAKLSDKIIVLKAGKISEIGTYDELKDSGSFKTDSNA
jgi:ABC-type bacteriocin/lantibiotic exporter with double-glycine peptidase domain